MLGGLLLILTGAYWTKEWCKDEQTEQSARQLAKKYNNPTYRDKWGNERYTKTGKKKTTADYQMELHNDLNKIKNEFQKKENEKSQRIKQFIDKKKKRYDELNIFKKYGLTLEEFIIATTPVPYKYDVVYEYYHSIISKISSARRTEIIRMSFDNNWRI